MHVCHPNNQYLVDIYDETLEGFGGSDVSVEPGTAGLKKRGERKQAQLTPGTE